MYKSINANELKKLSNINIIDIRDYAKYSMNKITNAINIPFETLLANPSIYLNKHKEYYIYCQKGFKSRMLCQILCNQGYNVININGGYEAIIMNY